MIVTQPDHITIEGELVKLNQWRAYCTRCNIMTMYFLHKEQAVGTFKKAVRHQDSDD